MHISAIAIIITLTLYGRPLRLRNANKRAICRPHIIIYLATIEKYHIKEELKMKKIKIEKKN